MTVMRGDKGLHLRDGDCGANCVSVPDPWGTLEARFREETKMIVCVIRTHMGGVWNVFGPFESTQVADDFGREYVEMNEGHYGPSNWTTAEVAAPKLEVLES